MKKALAPALDDFLDRNGLAFGDFNGFLFHPGGRKLLETMEEVLGLTRDQLRHSWEVLRRYGNMSSATALFVLEQAIQRGERRAVVGETERAQIDRRGRRRIRRVSSCAHRPSSRRLAARHVGPGL